MSDVDVRLSPLGRDRLEEIPGHNARQMQRLVEDIDDVVRAYTRSSEDTIRGIGSRPRVSRERQFSREQSPLNGKSYQRRVSDGGSNVELTISREHFVNQLVDTVFEVVR